MKIAIYSGSFNPLHIGHLAIMRYLTEKMDFDMVYLIVSPQNPLKDSSMSESGTERFKAAKSALKRHSELKVTADNIELNMPAPHYTIRTLDALKSREPENDFTLVIGADNLSVMRKWKDYSRILLEYGVAVYPRKGHGMEEALNSLLNENPEYKILIADAPMVEISSTEIREGIANGKDMDNFLM